VQYHCQNCDTTISGNFEISDFAKLSPAQQEFAKIFICSSGNIKEVEKQLKISYPTVKNRLAEIQALLCPQSKAKSGSKKKSQELLDLLGEGKLSVEQVLAQLKS